MRYSEHLDYMPLSCPGFGWQRTPPCNYGIDIALIATWAGYAATAASLASAAITYDSSQNQAKQSEMNAEAQNQAIGAEQQRLAAEQSENQRRAVMEQRRFRAQQLAGMAGTGAMIGTGSALNLEIDTWQKQQTELADQERVFQLGQRNLAIQGNNALQLGQQQSAAYKREGTGAAISGLASAAGGAYSSWSTRPQPVAGAYNRNTRQPTASYSTV